MQITALLLTFALSAISPTQQAGPNVALGQKDAKQLTSGQPPVDLEAAIHEAAMRIVAEDLGLEMQDRDTAAGQFVAADDGTGYMGMLYQNSYDPAALAFMAASVAEMYSASDLRTQCLESEIVTCSDPFPSTVQQDALITAGMYAGVTALQRLAKTQWDVDLDEGWKRVLIWGGVAAVRGFITAQNMSDANALRDLGR